MIAVETNPTSLTVETKRIGRFTVTFDFINLCISQGVNIFDQAFVLTMGEGCAVDTITYLIYHPDFFEFEMVKGTIYPEYILNFSKDEAGKIEVLNWELIK